MTMRVLALLLLLPTILALDNGLGRVPPMGWNSWNKFQCNIHEDLVKDAANKLIDLNLSALGYVYVNIDDCWMAPERDSYGNYQADPQKFPSGMKAMGNYLHNHGLMYGIYTSAGTKTCQGLPGSLGYEDRDAQTFSEWGVDYLKYDNCFNEDISSIDRYPKMRDALNATKRPIFYSLCQWGVEDVWKWAPAVGNSWRSTGDISPHWNSIKVNFLSSQEHIHRNQHGAWADPDMLEVGNGNLTHDEEWTHFALWALVKAPLLLGMDLSTITPETLNIISNPNLIKVNQDPGALPATCFVGCDHDSDWSAYATVITGGDTVAIIINWKDTELENITLAGQNVGVVPRNSQNVKVTDLWTDQTLGIFGFEQLKTLPIPSIPPHGSVVYRFSVQESSKVTLDNGLARVPPMGWNSWNKFGCSVSENVIRDAVHILAYSGLEQLGYRYVNIDDCWMAPNRTSSGNYQADPTKFPSGMNEIGNHIHKHGLLYGIYTSAGTKTCQGLPGSLGTEEQDAQTFADWGVDFLKYDNCYNEGIPSIDRYPKMRDALDKTGRPIFYSLCQWGEEDPWRWAPAVGNSWRSTGDIAPTWNSIVANFLSSQKHIHRSQHGAWADPDMLEVGNGNLSIVEEMTHFSLWALVKAPLLLGMDLTSLSLEARNIISNKNLIRVNQDPGARPATCFVGCDDSASWSVYATRVTGGDTVAIVVNWIDTELGLLPLGGHDVGVVPSRNEKVTVVDLWTNQVMGTFGFDELKTLPIPSIPPHGSVVYRFSTHRRSNGPPHAPCLKERFAGHRLWERMIAYSLVLLAVLSSFVRCRRGDNTWLRPGWNRQKHTLLATDETDHTGNR